MDARLSKAKLEPGDQNRRRLGRFQRFLRRPRPWRRVGRSDRRAPGGFRIDGIHVYESAGFSVSGAGDVNGDGLADLIVGAAYAAPGGAAYLVFGKVNDSTVNLAALGAGGFRIDGINPGDFAGRSVSWDASSGAPRGAFLPRSCAWFGSVRSRSGSHRSPAARPTSHLLGNPPHAHEAPSCIRRCRPCRRGRGPVASGADGSVVNAGTGHACSVRPDGATWCWGATNTGQLGDGAVAYTPVLPQAVAGLADVAAVSSGGSDVLDAGAFSLAEFSCALRHDGTVACWGANNKGQLGLGFAGAPQVQPQDVPGLSAIAMVSVGTYAHSCAVDQQGAVWCWGYNEIGQVGNGQAGAPVTAPQPVPGFDDAVAVSVGGQHSCALKQAGTVVCWGANYEGQLGLGLIGPPQPSPQSVLDLDDVVAIDLGDHHSCALRAGGTVLCWGYNGFGELGRGSASAAQPIPLAVANLDDAVAIAAGYLMSCALREGGGVVCWGDNSVGELGTGVVTHGDAGYLLSTPQPVQGLDEGVALDVGSGFACAQRADDSVHCWGWNFHGQLGDGRRGFATEPTPVVGLDDMVGLASGWFHRCALRAAGTVACWGNHSHGYLALGPDLPLGHYPTPQPVAGLEGAVAIESGGLHTCVLQAGGVVACWGPNWNGQLGTDTQGVASGTPLDVNGLVGVVDLGVGQNHTCAVLADGTVACWGDNSSGNLGTGVLGGQFATPQPVVGIDEVVDLSAGRGFSCALKLGGTVQCWGSNGEGQLGTGVAGDPQPTPQPVPGLADVLALSAAGASVCALKADRSLACWGGNGNGQIDSGAIGAPVPAPTTVAGLQDVAAVQVGNTSCALHLDGSVTCWGHNSFGSVGTGNYGAPATTPGASVIGLDDAVGLGGTCAVTAGGTATCWGYGARGMLGNGDLGYSAVPLPVAGPGSLLFSDGFE